MTAREYLEQLAQTAGLADDVKVNLLKAVENEKFSKGLEEGTMLRSDYSRQSDALKAEKDKTTNYYQQLLDWKAEQEAQIATWQHDNGQNGNHGNPRQTIQPVQSDFIPKKEFEDYKKQSEAGYINLLEVGLDLVGKHYHEFKEPLNIAELKKTAVDNNLSLQQAYDRMVSPRRAELSKAQLDAQLKAAREEGAREFASTHKIPIDSAPREYHVIHDRDPKKQVGVDDYVPGSGQLSPQASRALRDNFVESWNSATNTSGT